MPSVARLAFLRVPALGAAAVTTAIVAASLALRLSGSGLRTLRALLSAAALVSVVATAIVPAPPISAASVTASTLRAIRRDGRASLTTARLTRGLGSTRVTRTAREVRVLRRAALSGRSRLRAGARRTIGAFGGCERAFREAIPRAP